MNENSLIQNKYIAHVYICVSTRHECIQINITPITIKQKHKLRNKLTSVVQILLSTLSLLIM